MALNKVTTVLFGLDGVIVNTESYFDKFWNNTAQRSNLKIDNFAATVKGMTLNSIIDLYFNITTTEEKQAIRKAYKEFSETINYKDIVIDGAIDFIKHLRANDYKTGIVTNSSSEKTRLVLEQLSLENDFDIIVTSDTIKNGKPDSMGYTYARTNLVSKVTECVVFEDSLVGIKAAAYSFMPIISLSTSLPEDELKDYSRMVITDFSNWKQLVSLF